MLITEAIEASGFSDAELAVQMETNPSTVWRWRTGERKPSARNLMRLARILRCRPEDLDLT